jgi:hypothetical protein
MFGVLHWNKDVPDKTNYVELSEGSNVETGSQTILVSSPIRCGRPKRRLMLRQGLRSMSATKGQSLLLLSEPFLNMCRLNVTERATSVGDVKSRRRSAPTNVSHTPSAGLKHQISKKGGRNRRQSEHR